MKKKLLKQLARTGELCISISGPTASGKDLLASMLCKELTSTGKLVVEVKQLGRQTDLHVKNVSTQP